MLSGCAPGTAPHDGPAEIRNLLFIMGDDHAAYALGAYGNSLIRTPNLDRLAAQGIRFDGAYVNSPICTASRQSLITGRLPHAVGVTLLSTPLSSEEVTIADHLKRFGFRTGAVGKMHFNGNREMLRRVGFDEEVISKADNHHGFDYRIDGEDHDRYLAEHPARKPPEDLRYKPLWQPFRVPAREWLNADMLPGTGYPKPGDLNNQGLYDEDSLGTFFARRAIDFLRENRNERMCLWLSFYEPHSPFNFPIEYADKYDPADMPLPAVGLEDERWIPAIFRELAEEDKRGIVASYYASVEYLDKNVGLVLDALDRLGLVASTLVVYAGDHGYLLGHHGRFEKHMMWEEAIRAPLIMRNIPRLGEGKSIDALVEFVDVVPTLLELLQVPPMEGVQGSSLLPLLEGRTDRHRDYVFSEYLHDNKAMVRTEEWKYIFTSGKEDLAWYVTGKGAPGVTHRLYNLQQDPGETTNLAGEPGHREVLEKLQQKLLSRFQETHPLAGELPPDLSIEEALVWFCEPPDPRPPGLASSNRR